MGYLLSSNGLASCTCWGCVVELPCSGSSPPPPARRPARSSAAAPLSGTDMSPCETWRCSGPSALKNNLCEKPQRSQFRRECSSQCESEDLTDETCHRKRSYLLSFQQGGEADVRGLFFFLTGKRLVDISFYCLQEAHSLRLRQSQSSYDTNAWRGGRGGVLLTETKVTFCLREILSMRI